MPTYGDRYGAGPAFKPGSMALALGLTVAPIAGLIMGLQLKHFISDPPVLTTYAVPPDRPPPPPDRKPQPKTEAPTELVYTPPHPQVPVPPTDTFPTTETPPPPLTEPTVGKAPDPGPVFTPAVVAKPVMVDAFIDPRYQGLLQPPYPPEEQRAGNSGRVVLRVLVGTDGRVKQVEKVSAASDAFFAAAQRQALGKWRFKPATKDGVPIEQWQTMSLRFVLNEQ
ncbi:MAG TPA: energy transducer TonB [Sphingomonas sp.]